MNLQKWLPHIVLIFAVLASYANCLNNEFVWDDEFLIEKNTFLHSFSHLPKMLVSNSTAGFGGVDNFYRPTQNIYYLFIYQMFGQSKVAFHMGNVLLHALNALLIFSVFSSLLKSRSWAFFTSLLWALHPTHVEAIGYISGTADPMGLFFFLLGLRCMPGQDFRKHWGAALGAALCFVLSLMSKEAMIVIPALLILILAYQNPDRRWQLKTYWASLPFWVGAGAYMLVRKFWLNFNETFSFYKTTNVYTENMIYRIYTFLATLPEYLKILFYPIHLHMERHFPVFTYFTAQPVILGFCLVLVSFGLSLYLFVKKKVDWPLFCLLWFFISFVPMMGILVPVNSFILEHWLYLPSIGLFIVVARLLQWISMKISLTVPLSQKRLEGITMGLVALGLMIGTLHRNRDWRDPITFYSDILKYSEGSARVHNNIAMAYGDKKDLEKAIEHYQKAISLADAYPQTHYNLARAYIQLKQYDKAQQHLRRSLEINPNFIYSKNLLDDLQNFLRQTR